MASQQHIARYDGGTIHGERMEVWRALWRLQAARGFTAGWTVTSAPPNAALGSSIPAAEVIADASPYEMPDELRSLLAGGRGVTTLMSELDDAIREARAARGVNPAAEAPRARGA